VSDFDVQLPSGRLRARAWGDPEAPLVLCLHGLSANLCGFARIAPAVAAEGRRVVAVDLRGRGRSEDAGPYGIASHARDGLALADELGAEHFSLIGWSLGAVIGMAAAQAEPERLEGLVLIDHSGGGVDPAALDLIVAGLARLEAIVPGPDEYVEARRAAGTIDRWSDFWDAYYRYELEPAGDAWTPSPSLPAVTADLDPAGFEAVRDRWSALTGRILLVRATVPMGGGLVVPEEELRAFRAAVPQLDVLELDRNHFGVMDDERAVAAVAAFFS
jgi:pimeloyl-ACP methyl ester carboxylesterase